MSSSGFTSCFSPLGGCDRMKTYTHSVHLLLPLVISWQTDCGSIRVAIISVSDNMLLSPLWHNAVWKGPRMEPKASQQKLRGRILAYRQWRKKTQHQTLCRLVTWKIKSVRWHRGVLSFSGHHGGWLRLQRCQPGVLSAYESVDGRLRPAQQKSFAG